MGHRGPKDAKRAKHGTKGCKHTHACVYCSMYVCNHVYNYGSSCIAILMARAMHKGQFFEPLYFHCNGDGHTAGQKFDPLYRHRH